MGYSYDARGRLACDRCGDCGDTRRRPCPFKVRGLPYCSADALCCRCYAEQGGRAGHMRRHASCEAAAARAEAEYAARDEALGRGEFLLRSAVGDWHELVPAGFVGASFEDRFGRAIYRLVPAEVYKARLGAVVTPASFAGAVHWSGPYGAEVAV